MKDLYEILCIRKDATEHEIKIAYRTLSKKHHPDHGGTDAEFRLLAEAYRTLSDAEKRARYDSGETQESIRTATVTEEQKVMQLIIHGFLHVITTCDPDKKNIFNEINRGLKEALGKYRAQRNAEKLNIDKINRALKRIKSRTEDNFFIDAANGQIRQHEMGIKSIEDNLKIAEGAISFMENFSYELKEDDDPYQLLIDAYRYSMGT